MKKVILLLAVTLLLTGCADYVSFEQAAKINPVGFLHGLWHGMILPFAFIISLFDDTVSIYAIYNNGVWYNLGFLLGVSGILGGGAKAT